VGADAITLINTLVGMEIDIDRKRPVLGNIMGGLSGPAVKPVALRMAWQVAGAVRIPVIGIGGIATWQDALQFLLAGARAVQVGTACFYNPKAPVEIIEGLAAYMEREGVRSLDELIGAARPDFERIRSLPTGRLEIPKAAPVPSAPPTAPKRATGETADALRQWIKDSDRF
jgi:dihydroorotate dehydrogenase (NAD+) catalytic subunit